MAQPRGQLSLIHKKRETPGVSLFYMVCTSHSTRPYTTLAAVPNTMTGPATVNIFTAVPVIRPSARKSTAGDTTALAKPVMGTSVPAPAQRAS